MPRKTRIHVPGALYHVTLRGNHRLDIFIASRTGTGWKKSLLTQCGVTNVVSMRIAG